MKLNRLVYQGDILAVQIFLNLTILEITLNAVTRAKVMKFFSLDYTDAPYHDAFGDHNIFNYTVYTERGELIGKVVDVLIDEMEHSYYLAVEHRSSFSQERLILPLIASNLSPTEHLIYTTGLSREQINNLPPYRKENITRYSKAQAGNVSADVQPNVVSTNQSTVTAVEQMETLPVEVSLPLEYSRPLESDVLLVTTETQRPVLHPTPVPEQPTTEIHSPVVAPTVPTPTESIHDSTGHDVAVAANPVPPAENRTVEAYNIPLLAERLVVDRRQRKVGEVVVRKVIETQMVTVPVRREKLIVEQVSPESRPLAAIELGKGELSQVELRQLMPGVSDDTIQAVSDQAAIQTVSSVETVPIQTALQILRQVSHVSQFKHASVKLVFDDEDLQNRYQHWLAEHKN